MFEKIFNSLSGLKVTVVGGIFLIISLIFILAKITPAFDPIWLTIVICGYPLLYLAITRLYKNEGIHKISSALLIVIAMAASIFIGESFAAGEIAFIMAIGGILEDKTIDRAQKGIRKLINLTPDNGRVIIDGKEETLPIKEINKNSILRVLPGETIPIDGTIISGNTSIDQSVMTGESLPVDKQIGDSVFSGTINRYGTIDIITTKVGDDSSLQKLIRLVKEAENSKAPTQRIVDRWAAWLVPAALIISVLTYIGTKDVTRAVTILVVFCPCALVLATPTSIMAAIGQATKYGVIVKSGEALEAMGKVNIVAFDKTGTLTHGNLKVSDIITFEQNVDEDKLLKLCASIESRSEHPIGKAIVHEARDRDMRLEDVENFSMIPGKGVNGEVSGELIFCGNMSYYKENSLNETADLNKALKKLRSEGKAIIIVFNTNKLLGIVALSDTLRESSEKVIKGLKNLDTSSILLTGDHKQTGTFFADKIGIEHVYSELLPEEKLDKINELKKTGNIVSMIGDGVNDAPALKAADVGIAMGTFGSDIAIEAANIALMGDDVSKVPYLKRLSVATVRLIKINIILSMTVNVIAIILSVVGILNPVTGALVHNVSSILIVLNAVFLYDRNFID